MHKTAMMKRDAGKPPMSLLATSAKIGLAHALAYGARKYARHDWRKGMRWSRVLDAAYRHLDEHAEGQDLDDESGLPHVDLAQACMHILSEYHHRGLGIDDRYNPLHAEATARDDKDNSATEQQQVRPVLECEDVVRRLCSGCHRGVSLVRCAS